MAEDEEMEAILREAFGDSSSDSDGASSENRRRRVQDNNSSDAIVRHHSIFGDTHTWERIREINGLWICRDFMSEDQQSALLSALEKEGYLGRGSHNQAMKFGDLPAWALELSYYIREDVVMICEDKLLWREPLFDQFIVNTYQPGEGICAHVDLMRFEDGIAIVSLESSCVMHFTSVKDEATIPVLLNPGSVVLMRGEARYQWKHEINRNPAFQIWGGQEIQQKRRISVTFRRLCVPE